MSARVTAGQVKELVETSKEDAVIEALMIETADAIVDEHLAGKLSDRMLDQIELYLAAHFLALAEERGGLIKSDFGNSEEWLSDMYQKGGFNATRFGQQAIALDTTGTLAKIGTTRLKAELRVV